MLKMKTKKFTGGRRKNEQISRLVNTLTKTGDFKIHFKTRIGNASPDPRIIINHDTQGAGDRIREVNLNYRIDKLTGKIEDRDSHYGYDLSPRIINENEINLSLKEMGVLQGIIDIDDFIYHIKTFSEIPSLAISLSDSIANYTNRNRALFSPDYSFKKYFLNKKLELMLCSPLDSKSGTITHREPFISISADDLSSSKEVEKKIVGEFSKEGETCGAEKYYLLDNFEYMIEDLNKN